MAPTLPSSLSPHICVVPSPDLSELLESYSLPPLDRILQSFSPLQQVATRTTSLISVPHVSFALRFSDLSQVEEACKEDEVQRAARTLDWIGSRIGKRCAKWVADMSEIDAKQPLRTPWFDELKRCAESDYVPSKVEGWNHPVSLILAISTTAPNPLQAITTLHSRLPDFPLWVDQNYIRCILILHPRSSTFSDEEAGALFNAVKKQFGLHTYIIPLDLPSPPPMPIPISAAVPRLPPPSPEYSPNLDHDPPTSPNGPVDGSAKIGAGVPLNGLRLIEEDKRRLARFTRDFVVSSLIPWMEKCVVDWNENYTSTRRLPSRLFTSTRRLFGTSAGPASPSPASPAPGVPHRSQTYSGPANALPGNSNSAIPQLRRLAEFSTILGDYKLAVSLWEALRKEGKGGSEILPLLLAPAPTIPLHATHALSTIHPPTSELPPHAQLRALIYAIRWEIGIPSSDFLGDVLEGERWLVWAAGDAEEPSSALLLAHAALLSSRKDARRRATLWYLFAAHRLQKCGIKPLAMYFLRRAHELYQQRPEKLLSPSFWESEGRSPSDVDGFDAIITGIEHPLGRLLYTMGDVAGAVGLFLSLLRGASKASANQAAYVSNGDEVTQAASEENDSVFLEDFRVALMHLKNNAVTGSTPLSDLKLPFTFCQLRHTRVRLPRDSDNDELDKWDKLEDEWKVFWRGRGKESLEESGKASANETFWVDLVLRNPLNTEVNLTNITVTFKEVSSGGLMSASDFLAVDTCEEVILDGQETRTVPITVKSSRPASLVITHMSFNFISLLSCEEYLGRRGRRLHDTPAQRQGAVYAPDTMMKVEVQDASLILQAGFVDDDPLELAHGECKPMDVWFRNRGTGSIGEVWLVKDPQDELWLDNSARKDQAQPSSSSTTEVLRSSNTLVLDSPYCILPAHPAAPTCLNPDESGSISVVFHASRIAQRQLRLLLLYREKDGTTFRSCRLKRYYEVGPLLNVSAVASPSQSPDELFRLDVNIENVCPSDEVNITQITTVSPTWSCQPKLQRCLGVIHPFQLFHLSFDVTPWKERADPRILLQFVSGKLRCIIRGELVESTEPPPVDLLCSHLGEHKTCKSVQDADIRHFIHSSRRDFVRSSLAASHPAIAVLSHSHVFPLYHPHSVDVVLFWDIPSDRRSGHLLVSGLTVGVGHGILKEIIDESENSKVKRSMYAETRRERLEMIESIRNSEWNAEMNPLVLTFRDDGRVPHDFTKGSCHVPVIVTIRNYSLTHLCRYILKLPGPSISSGLPSSDLLPAQYSGRLTFRGSLNPGETTTHQTKLYVTRPGSYALRGWVLESEVGDVHSETGAWRTRFRYLQESSTDQSCIVVYNDASS